MIDVLYAYFSSYLFVEDNQASIMNLVYDNQIVIMVIYIIDFIISMTILILFFIYAKKSMNDHRHLSSLYKR